MADLKRVIGGRDCFSLGPQRGERKVVVLIEMIGGLLLSLSTSLSTKACSVKLLRRSHGNGDSLTVPGESQAYGHALDGWDGDVLGAVGDWDVIGAGFLRYIDGLGHASELT